MSVPRPTGSSIPDAPGAYLFRDPDGRVVYVGKARSLRKRLANYWSRPLHPRTEAMVTAAARILKIRSGISASSPIFWVRPLTKTE